jgi:hypothetical protein
VRVAVGAGGGGGGGAGGGAVCFFPPQALTMIIIARVATINAHFMQLRFTYSSNSEDSVDLQYAGLGPRA